MMFKTDFPKTVYPEDRIECEVDGFTCRATLYYDDDTTPPDKRMDGFWPSLNPKDAGYIGAKSKRTLGREYARMKHVMDSWLRDEWHYYGVAVTVWRDGVMLTGEYDHAVWGIEGNWPSRRKNVNPNAYFRTVANENLADALDDAKAKVAKWCEAVS